jgi:arginine N-succinyltransferase
MIIRPIRKDDLDAFEKLAFTSSLGITNLPQNRAILEKKIEASLAAFAKNIDFPENEKYIFVLENLESGKIGGTCGILSQTGVNHPVYCYRIEKLVLKNEPKEIHVLKPVAYKNAPSEIMGLYLHPDFRKGGIGKLLSLSRLLFIAAFKKRFRNAFFANIRGVISEDNISPFWESLGKHFLNLNYSELMKKAETGREFIGDILPKYPVYIPLLRNEAQDVIGKPHDKSQPAFSMLEEEGFHFANEVDVFDGGPYITAKTSKIKTITQSVVATIKSLTDDEITSEKYLLGNESLDFRACFGNIKFVNKKKVVLNRIVAEILGLKVGDKVRYTQVNSKIGI